MATAPKTIEPFTPTTAAELARFVGENSREAQRPLCPTGGRTALHYGHPLNAPAVPIVTGRLNRVVEYPARDQTITVEAGIRVEDLQETLAAEGQRLAVDVAQAHRATLGGAIATNTSGPGRFACGTFRDYVIGVSAVDGRGRLFSAGGRVVKNVAGYDLCKLLIGSLGTLAVITQVTLKLRPRAEVRRAVWATFENLAALDAVLEMLTASQTRPLAIELLNAKAAWQVRSEAKADLPVDRPVLCVVFEGSEAETGWQVDVCREELAAHAPAETAAVDADDLRALWSALVEYQAASDDPLTFQATIPPSRVTEFVALADVDDVAVQTHAGNGIVIGHLPDSCSTAADARTLVEPLRAFAEAHQGALVVLNCDSAWIGELPMFGGRIPNAGLSRRLKEKLDPHHLLNPGRLPFAE